MEHVSRWRSEGLSSGAGIWMIPLVGLAVISTAMLRPEPPVHPFPSSRTITDMTGKSVPVKLPFRGVGMTWGSSLREFYTVTGAPEAVLAAWPFAQLEVRDTVLREFYPRAPKHTEFWQSSGISNGQGPNANVETLLRSGASVFFGYSNMAPVMSRVGIPFAGGLLILKEELLFPNVRMIAGSVGNAERGEMLIKHYREDFEELQQELRAASVGKRPSVLMVTVPSTEARAQSIGFGGRVNRFWQTIFERAAVENAVDDSSWLIRKNAYSTGVERLLALNPDIIILTDGLFEKTGEHDMGPRDFISERRFRAMRAVGSHRVYRYPRGFTVNMFGVIETPIAAHWISEIAHPDILKWRTRTLLRQRIQEDLNIDATEAQLDEMLSVRENVGMLHAERFERVGDGK